VFILGAGHTALAGPSPAYADRLALQELLRQGDFQSLDARLAAIQSRYESGEEDDRALGHAFGAFASTEPELEERLNEWADHSPESFRPYLARGIYYEHIGWTRRGAKRRGKTAEEQFRQMRAAFEKALADLERARTLSPRMPVSHAEIVRISKAFVDGSRLRAIAERGLAHDPASFTIRFAAAFGLRPRWSGGFEDLRAFSNETERHIRDNAVLAGIRGVMETVEGDTHRRQGRYEEALAAYDRAIRFGELHFFYGKRARLHHAAGRYDAAVEDFNRALELWPQNPYILRKRADVARSAGRLDQALDDYDLVLALDPFNPDAAEGKAHVLLRQDRAEEALAAAKTALEYGAYDASKWNLAGWLLNYPLDRHEEAIEYFSRAADLEPDKPNYRYNLIHAQYSTRDCEVVPQMDRYLELCEAGGECREKRTMWVKQARSALLGRGICS
jgi:tetratricopeptide (TPR) repeat protein